MENSGWRKVKAAFWSVSLIIICITIIHVGSILIAGLWGVEHMREVVSFLTGTSQIIFTGIVSIITAILTNRETIKMLIEKCFGNNR